MATREAIVYVGQIGANMYSHSLRSLLYTEEQIGLTADRILWTDGKIGEMTNRIVHVIELSQWNTILFIWVVISMTFLGLESGMSKYQVSLNPVSSLPWPINF